MCREWLLCYLSGVRVSTMQPLIMLLTAALLLSILLLPMPSQAHPHSWIGNTLTLQGEATQIDSLEMEWVFDPFTSAYALDGDFSIFSDEVKSQLEAQRLMSNLLNTHYFTYLYVDGQPLKFRIPSVYSLTKQGRRMVLTFILPLSKSIDVSNQRLDIQTYDNTYFIDITWKSKQAIIIDPALSASCRVALQQPEPSQAIQQYAMSLERDSVEDSELGQHFSQTVSIGCG